MPAWNAVLSLISRTFFGLISSAMKIGGRGALAVVPAREPMRHLPALLGDPGVRGGRGDERQAGPLVDRPGGQDGAAVHGADHAQHRRVVGHPLGDQRALFGHALVVPDHDLHLGPAQAAGRVHFLDGHLHRARDSLAGLGPAPGEGADDGDLEGRRLRRRRSGGHQAGGHDGHDPSTLHVPDLLSLRALFASTRRGMPCASARCRGAAPRCPRARSVHSGSRSPGRRRTGPGSRSAPP